MKKLSEQQLKILEMVGTFGYLSTRDIAKLAWPSNEAHSAHVMAQAAASKLAKAGLLFARDPRIVPGMAKQQKALLATRGVPLVYVLTARGADIMNEEFMDEWVVTPFDEDKASVQWFADGYDLSLKGFVVRGPVIDFCQFMLAKATVVDQNDPTGESRIGLRVVGPRGAAGNFLGLQQFTDAQFSALLIDAGARFVAGVHLADGITSNATTKVVKLAKRGRNFFIVNEPRREAQLHALIRHRAEHNLEMAKRVYELLPTGGMA